MENYFKLKLYIGFILPMVLLIVLFIIRTIWITIDTIKEKRINKFFLSNGYERRLFDVSSVGAKSFYGWVRESDNKRVDDRDIRGWSFKQIRNKYK